MVLEAGGSRPLVHPINLKGFPNNRFSVLFSVTKRDLENSDKPHDGNDGTSVPSFFFMAPTSCFLQFGTLLGDEMRSGKPGKPCNGNDGTSVPPFFFPCPSLPAHFHLVPWWCNGSMLVSSIVRYRFDSGSWLQQNER